MTPFEVVIHLTLLAVLLYVAAASGAMAWFGSLWAPWGKDSTLLVVTCACALSSFLVVLYHPLAIPHLIEMIPPPPSPFG